MSKGGGKNPYVRVGLLDAEAISSFHCSFSFLFKKASYMTGEKLRANLLRFEKKNISDLVKLEKEVPFRHWLSK
jgi:hypothetical protein